MARDSYRLSFTLDGEHAEKLVRLAARTRVPKATLAGSLLCAALDKAEGDALHVGGLLDAVPGAFERGQLGRMQAEADETIPIEDL